MTKPTQDKETLREAVARALCENMTLGTGCIEHFYGTADAAIATMFERLRTPSERMIEAGSDKTIPEAEIDLHYVWQAMLTAFQQENSDA